MGIITQPTVFDYTEIEILGDLERCKLLIENVPDKKIKNKLDINEEIFINNRVTKDMKNEQIAYEKCNNIVLSRLEWTEFYNMDVFFSSSSELERRYLEDTTYNSYVRLYLTNSEDVKIFLNPDGFIVDVDETDIYPLNGEEYISREDLIGMKIEDLAILLEKRYNCIEE